MNKQDELFQERIDELLLIEERVERRSEKFIEIVNNYQNQNRKIFNHLLGNVEEISESLSKINTASDNISEYVTLCEKHARHTTKVFLGAVVAAVLIVAGALFCSYFTYSDLDNAKTELANLNTKLKHTPVIVNYHGKDYVRVVSNTEKQFTKNGKKMPGRYAKMWHVK